jgi:hypothetical protein
VKTKTHDSKRKKRWYVREEMIKKLGQVATKSPGAV